jgi:hypothetical protein
MQIMATASMASAARPQGASVVQWSWCRIVVLAREGRRQSCSIALYPASSLSEKVSFNRINRKTGNRLKQQNVDSETGEVAPPASAGNRSLNLQPDEPNILLNCQANCPKCSDDIQGWWRSLL